MNDRRTGLLVLAYHYPPVGGAGVQRTAAFCRSLPQHGYDPVVVTGRASTGRWTPEDRTLVAGLAHATYRVTTPEPDAGDGSRLTDRLARVGLWRSRWSTWWARGSLAAGREALRACEIGAIVATMSPYESAAVAARLSAEAGVPWIADLRDPWALDEMLVYPSGLHRRRAMKRMGRDLATASAVVMNTESAAAATAAAFPHLRHVTWIPNGFDPDDFATTPPAHRGDGVLRIVHTGYLHTALGLSHRARRLAARGGCREPVDILARSHVHLLDALAGLEPAELAAVELHLAGRLSGADEAAIEASGIADRVHVHGYLDHAASIALVRGADLLFLPMHDLPAGGRALIVPGKLYEYLASTRPILAAVPAGDARDLLTYAGTGRLCAPTDTQEMRTIVLRELVALGRAGGAAVPPPELLRRYERPRQAAELAGLLDGVVGAHAPARTGANLNSPAR